MHKLTNPTQSAEKLTQSVIQVAEMFAMYQAELARILHVTCSDIGQFATGKQFLNLNNEVGEQAMRFIRLYELLFESFDGNEVDICHWLRVNDKDLGGIPLYLMVDDGELIKVLEYVEHKML